MSSCLLLCFAMSRAGDAYFISNVEGGLQFVQLKVATSQTTFAATVFPVVAWKEKGHWFLNPTAEEIRARPEQQTY